MQQDILETALRLKKAGEPFVLATVIRAEKPTSAKPGASALITFKGASGEWVGWIGGSCSKSAVALEARRVLASGQPKVLSISSTETCDSGGSLDIYLEPHLPRPQLVVIGHLPVAEALVALAGPLGFRVTVMSPEASKEAFASADEFLDRIDFRELPRGERFVVVASHGNYDEEALRAALGDEGSQYVALVSSRKRAEAMLGRLGLSKEQRRRLKYPAGLDIGATTAEEIALSILAEMVQLRRSRPRPVVIAATEPSVATDPICGMTVDVATAVHVLEKNGTRYYFCCAGCKERYANAV
ncbi:MAG TPA: XdhC family protein [Vicinamibacteria bacterium]